MMVARSTHPQVICTGSVVQPRYLIMMGMSVVAVALWHMTSLTPDASFGFFAYARVFLMIGLPFLFIPISTAAYVGLPPQKTDQASSLINVARNIGGSIGVSLSNTVIAQNAQLHQSVLVAQLPRDPFHHLGIGCRYAQVTYPKVAVSQQRPQGVSGYRD